MPNNVNLSAARAAKKDEFYTQLSDIEKELKHYIEHFRGKVVYCNCDNPEWSNFYKFFKLNFDSLGLKKLITTHYEHDKPSYKLELTESDVIKTPLQQNGDFRSPECVEILKEADIVVTNPPFSLFREYIGQLMQYGKKFVVIGNVNAITYKEFFPLLKEGKVWLGYGGNIRMTFRMPDDYELKGSSWMGEDGHKYTKMGSCAWFTNLDIQKRHEQLILCKEYNPEEYPTYDNYDAINVDKVKDIPKDYVPCWFDCPLAEKCEWAKAKGMDNSIAALCDDAINGVMGVPITFLDKYCPEQFEVLGVTQRNDDPFKTKKYTVDEFKNANDLNARGVIMVNGTPKPMYARILIRRSDKPPRCNGIMGVPITFLDKYCPEQFEILGLLQSSTDEQAGIPNLRYYNDCKEMRQDMSFTGANGGKANGNPVVKGKSANGNFLFNPETGEYVHSVYARILIRRKRCNGVMGVPITFLDKYCPEQFEIVDANMFRANESVPFKKHGLVKDKDSAINGKPIYARILIRRS